MNKVKERMRQLKDAIEVAEQRAVDAKNGTRETVTKLDKSEGEKTTLLSRIIVVRREVEKIHERLEDSNAKLDNAVARSQRSEVRRKLLAVTEVDDFEQSQELEDTVKAAGTSRANAEHMVVEVERKVVILERDLARAQAKYEKFTVRVEQLTAEVSDTSRDIRALEEKDRIASGRDDENEEKVKFLETQLRDKLGKAEGHERDVAKFERLIEQHEQEILKCNEKHEDLKVEIEALKDDAPE